MPGRGRLLQITWRESADELWALVQQERNGHRRARYRAFWLLRQGHSIGAASQAVGVDYRTVQRWVAWYRTEGLAAVVRRTPGYAAPGQSPRLSPDQRDRLRARAASGAFRTVRDAVAWVEREFGITYTYSGMHALLKRHAAPET